METLPPRLSFSKVIPNLQLAWDSTSLGVLKECPRKYYYSIILGKQPIHENVHLKFGQLYHSALEYYDHMRSRGEAFDKALLSTVKYVLDVTWDKELGRPWMSMDPNKNRLTLLRTVVWYLLQFEDDPVETIQLSNGKPAVELSFRFNLGIQSRSGEDLLYCGHFDRLVEFQERTYVLDRKTTKHTIQQEFFLQYSPDNQFSGYIAGGNVVYHKPIFGLIVDVAQVAVGFSRFARGLVERTPDQIDEWFESAGFYIQQAQDFAEKNFWPMNDKSCHKYAGCDFRMVCSKAPAQRPQWLTNAYKTRLWDPLQIRGDI